MEKIYGEIKEYVIYTGEVVYVAEDGRIFNNKMIEKKQSLGRGGYLHISSKGHHIAVHRLVAGAYLGNLEVNSRTQHVHHINENKLDNRKDNLVILSAAEHDRIHNTKYPTQKRCVVCGKIFVPSPTKRLIKQTCSRPCCLILRAQKNKKTFVKVMQYTKDGEYIKTWDSEADAARSVGGYSSNIVKCCKGIILSYKGYRWEYERSEAKT